MNLSLEQTYPLHSLENDPKTMKRIQMALKKSKELDQAENMDLASQMFRYNECSHSYWNPEPFSLLYGTYLWDQSSQKQKIILNQLYWVAYYSQIISAEIATIFFNQTSAAALYGIEDFRSVCDTLDLESAQERAHIHAFKKVSEELEFSLFGERIFTYPMRTPFVKTMLYSDLSQFQQWWRKNQLRLYTVLSSNSAFIGCQYFTVRGLRTLNGKIVQHQLSKYYTEHTNREAAPIPAKISYYHFMDESFHFNTSTVISHDVVNNLPSPNKWEAEVANMTLLGCQKDHFNFSTAINGIFWYDPALYPQIYKVLRSPVFGMDKETALLTMEKSFCEESAGALASAETHSEAVDSYKAYLADFKYVSAKNKEMKLMSQNSLARHLRTNRDEFKKFKRTV
ncbi:MAG: P-aminobenzoate N-oxygenase AurF [Bdellovibrionota bacterium]|mgnify:CR=1 FL=1